MFTALPRKLYAACVLQWSSSMKSINSHVDGAEQVLPLSSDPHVCLVHPPGARAVALMPANALLELKRVAPHPPEDCRGVDLNSAFLHDLREVAIGDAVLAASSHANQDDFDRKTTALEDGHLLGFSTCLSPYTTSVNV